MNKFFSLIRFFSIICVIVLCVSAPAYADQEDTTISSDSAVELALMYYAINHPKDKNMTISSHIVTPLIDNEGNITYYCVDFFNNQQSVGYVVVGSDLRQMLCTEVSYDEASDYYINSSLEVDTIYYNPFSVYTLDEDTSLYFDQDNLLIEREQAVGSIYSGDKSQNRELIQVLSLNDMPEENYYYIDIDPYIYLQNLGFTNVSCNEFGTLQSSMQAANAFNPMITIPKVNGEYTEVSLSSGMMLSNPNHCAITVMANILLYWRQYRLMSNLPSTYEEMFTSLMLEADSKGYMSRYALYDENGQLFFDGLNVAQARIVMRNVVTQYGYSSIFSIWDENEESDWNFLTGEITANKPVYLSFNENNVPEDEGPYFVYDSHVTIAYGYTVMNAHNQSDAYLYRFVKLYDVWTENPNRYISWEAIEQSQFNFDIVDNKYIDRSIDVNMFSFMRGKT